MLIQTEALIQDFEVRPWLGAFSFDTLLEIVGIESLSIVLLMKLSLLGNLKK